MTCRLPCNRRRAAPRASFLTAFAIVAFGLPSLSAAGAFEWTLEDVPSRANLKAVWGASPAAVFAVGDSGTVLRFDGTTWSKIPFPFGDQPLRDVWGTSASDVYAVDANRLYRYDGTQWALFPVQPFVPGFQALALWGTSPSHIVVVGQGQSGSMGPVRLWDGAQWSTPVQTPAAVTDVWGTGPNNVYAITGNGAIFHTIECQPGRLSWEVVAFQSNDAKGLWGSGPDDVYMGSFYGAAHRVSGPDAQCREGWTQSGNVVWLRGVWGRAPDEVYAVGTHPGLSIGCYIQRFDGTAWRVSPTPAGHAGPSGSAPAGLQAIWGDTTGDFWAVGDRGTVLRNAPSEPDTQLVVNSTAGDSDRDPGDGRCDTGRVTADGEPECTLCAAIQEANADAALDTITFDIHTSDPGYRSATESFEIAAGLPAVTQPVRIDATTQAGFAGRPKIEINATGRLTGFLLQGGGTTLRGFCVRGAQGDGIHIETRGGNTVAGCFIGTDVTGLASGRNQRGILIRDSGLNTIGGAAPGDRNVIAGNGLSGVTIGDSTSVGNRVIGNVIGLDASGDRALANAFHGVLLDRFARGTVIGGPAPGEGNVIAGNADHGVALFDAVDTRIVGNRIGVDRTGAIARPNLQGGIVIEGESRNTTIGGAGPLGNVLSGNAGDAIGFVGAGVVGAEVLGNAIGVDATRLLPLPNGSDGIEIEDAGEIRIGSAAVPGGENTIARNTGLGVRIRGTATKITLEGNRIGYSANDTLQALNLRGAIRIEGGNDLTIGGTAGGAGNRIFGDVVVVGAGTRGVRLLGNDLDEPLAWLDGNEMRLPFDLGGDGPSCNCGGEAGRPNAGVATARILAVRSDVIEGMAAPNATVFVYRVFTTGQNRARYFPKGVESLAHGEADGEGFFAIPVSLAVGDRVTVAATDADGNTSEFVQVRRPVIFAHGIGGAWLQSAGGSYAWLPSGLTASAQNDNLARMAMKPDGSSVEPIAVPEMLESVATLRVVYGPIMDWLDDHHYTGEAHNHGTATLEAWRYYYDWRKSPAEAATGLKDLVDRVTSDDPEIARSCDVDLVAHSYGCVVGNVYVRGEPAHSRCRVHRFLTIGAPTLGTPLAAGAHTRGYVFELEKEHIYGTLFGYGMLVHWGRMIEMARNLSAAYSLLPGRKYWDTNPGDGTRQYLEDLDGRPLDSHQAVADFLNAPKTDARFRPLGLARNGAMWERELQRVHDVSDDWRDYRGPPQVFRVVGRMEANTIIRWTTAHSSRPSRLRYPFQTNHDRYETGDEFEHWAYREMLTPVLGLGDGTVALSSATLGHQPQGGVDYSGVGTSHWIEDFEYFPCKHNDMLLPECEEGGKKSLDYVIRVLDSGSRVIADPPGVPRTSPPPPADGRAVAAGGPAPADSSEVFYVFASAPILVHVRDDSSRHVGPVDPGTPGAIEYEIPEVGYWATGQNVCVAFPRGRRYTIEVAAAEAAELRVVRIVTDGHAANGNLLFPEVELPAGGALRFVAIAAGAPPHTPLERDLDGDGAYEGANAPAALLNSAFPGPAIPSPRPFVAAAVGYRTDTGPRRMVVRFPDVGGPVWQWSATRDASWYAASALAGATPDSLVITFDAASLAAGVHTDTLSVTLTHGGYSTTMPVEVRATVYDAASVARLAIDPSYVVLRPGERHTFNASAFDEAGAPLAASPTWSAEGGTVDESGAFTAGAFNGLHFVTATSGGIEAEAVVEVVGGSDPPPTTPASFALHQNFPNPFDDGTVIAFDVQRATHVRLALFDVSGRLVATLVDADFAAGRHTQPIRSGAVSNGVFFYRIDMDGFSRTRKMVSVGNR